MAALSVRFPQPRKTEKEEKRQRDALHSGPVKGSLRRSAALRALDRASVPGGLEGVFLLFFGFSSFWGVLPGLAGRVLVPGFGVCHGSFRFRFCSCRPALRAGRGASLWPARVGGARVLGFVLLLGGAGLLVRAVPVARRRWPVRRPGGVAAGLARGRPSGFGRFPGFLGGRPARAGLRGQGVLAVRRVGGCGPRLAPSAGLPGGGVRPWLGLAASWRWQARAGSRRRPPRWSRPCAARWWRPGVRWWWGVALASMPPSLAAPWLRPGAASLPRGFRACAPSALAGLALARLRRFRPCRPSRLLAVRCRGGLAASPPFRCARALRRALARWWRWPRRGAWCSSVRPARAARCWPPAARLRVACRCSPSRSGFRARPCRRSGRVPGCRPAPSARGLRRGVGCRQTRVFSRFLLVFFISKVII